ncbi:proteasome assembly chaperone 4-like [Branchiostoma floridae x Branchiostoma japonicum]
MCAADVKVDVSMTEKTKATVEEAQPTLGVHCFSERVFEQAVHFRVLKLKDSFFLWVGLQPSMANLAVALPARFDSIPSTSALLGEFSDTTSCTLAQKLCKHTGKQVFVSCNLPTQDGMFLVEVEKRIHKEIKDNPEKFWL